jgi:hypothetical protein
MVDLIQDIKDEAIFKSAAEALLQKRLGDLAGSGRPGTASPLDLSTV